MKDVQTTKRKASSSSSAVDKSKKKGKKTHTKSLSATKQSANTAPLTKPQPKMSSGTASNHLDAVSHLVAPGHPLNKPCDHVASKVHNKKIKFKDGEVYSCQNAKNVDHDCTRAYCKGCFAKFIQGPEDKAVSSKNRRAQRSSTTTATCCEHSKSSSYKQSNKVYVTKSCYNNGSLPLPTHYTGCGGEFV